MPVIKSVNKAATDPAKQRARPLRLTRWSRRQLLAAGALWPVAAQAQTLQATQGARPSDLQSPRVPGLPVSQQVTSQVEEKDSSLPARMRGGGREAESPGLRARSQTNLRDEIYRPGELRHSHMALVVGCSAYGAGAEVPNAVADAEAVAARLQRLGYQVVILRDPSRDDILEALAMMRAGAHEVGQVVVYFAGHGVMQGGQAYFLPGDSVGPAAVPPLPVMFVARALSNLPRHKVIFFDACRTPAALKGTVVRRAGLDWPAGLTVAYASAPGGEAYDGQAGHSPFAQAFLRHVQEDARPLEEVLRLVRLDVLRRTHGAQVPWEQSSMLAEVYLQARS